MITLFTKPGMYSILEKKSNNNTFLLLAAPQLLSVIGCYCFLFHWMPDWQGSNDCRTDGGHLTPYQLPDIMACRTVLWYSIDDLGKVTVGNATSGTLLLCSCLLRKRQQFAASIFSVFSLWDEVLILLLASNQHEVSSKEKKYKEMKKCSIRHSSNWEFI